MKSSGLPQKELMFGHPVGLFTLFFAEMWERFSYYGMRALLLFYMTKGFLGYGDNDAYAVYGAYTALVYMTPFFGGLLADRILGSRRAVIFGGLLMCVGQAMLMFENTAAFYTGLALLVCGNGFFKPNISTIVGTLYPKGSPKRDGGFTIFYMGVNLGAALSPLVCGYIGELYGWRFGFGLASLGMLIGVAIFVAPTLITQLVIMTGALATAGALCWFHPDDIFTTAVNVFVGLALVVAAIVACTALGRGGLPTEAGAPRDPEKLRRPVIGFLCADHLVYLGALVAIPIFFLLVSGFATADSSTPRHFAHQREHHPTAGEQRQRYPAGGGRRVDRDQPAGRIGPVRLGSAGGRLPGDRDVSTRPHTSAAHVRRPDPDLLLHAVLVVLRAGRQFAQQLHRPQC